MKRLLAILIMQPLWLLIYPFLWATSVLEESQPPKPLLWQNPEWGGNGKHSADLNELR